MTNNNPQHPPHGLDILAGALAILFPGLGHLARGQFRRGLLAGGSVLALFFGGMLIGGIDIVDSREDKWWFLGQAFVGPVAVATDWAHQNMFKAYNIPPAQTRDPQTGKPRYETTQLRLAGPHGLRSLYPHETRRPVSVTILSNAGEPIGSRVLPVAVPASQGQGPPNRKSLAKVNELGTLYALCAGMLNLIVILDAVFPSANRFNTPPTPKGGSA